MPVDSNLIVIAAPPQVPTDDLRERFAAAGYRITSLVLGTHERLDFATIGVVVIAVGETLAFAEAQTRLWRAEMGDHGVPFLWLLPYPSTELTAAGLDAGADVCLARPVDPGVLIGQIKALLRTRRRTAELTARTADIRPLNEQLRRAYSEIDRVYDLVRRVRRAYEPQRMPDFGGVRIAVAHRPRSRVGGDLYDVVRLDEDHIGFWLADAGSTGGPAGGLLGLLIKQAVVLKEIHTKGYRLVPPCEVLARVNRELLILDLDPPCLVGMACGQVDTRTGKVAFARAGIPPAIFLPKDGSPEIWTGPGPHLGAFEAEFPPQYGKLEPGDRLVLFSDGARPTQEPDPIPQILLRHRELRGQPFVDAVCRDGLAYSTEPDDATLLAIEFQSSE